MRAESPNAHLQQQISLLRAEYEYEKEEFRLQTESKGISRMLKRGTAWWPLKCGRSYYNSLNQLVLEVTRTEDTGVEHAFEYGKPVVFFTMSEGKLSYFNFSCHVSWADEKRLCIVMPDAQAVATIQQKSSVQTDGLGRSTTGVQLFFDETSYQTMFDALGEVIRATDNRLAELKNILLSTAKPTSRTLAPMSFPWLNPMQEQAVNGVLRARDVSIVHGPPGTGKTTTLVEAIYETLRRENQVLVCAQSNTAVDWISEKLSDHGINILRIGNPSRVNDKMLSFTYERRFESHPLYHELWSIRRELRRLRSVPRRRSSMQERDALRNRMSRLRERATTLEFEINNDLLSHAHVIASTLVSSNHRILQGMRFSTLFVDEAAQALEAACWIAIRRADRVVLAGDHCQLPPTVKNPEAARNGLSRTLMEIVAERHPEAVTQLQTQYRMNEAIMRFPGRWFYDGKLTADPMVRYRSILDLDVPVSWIDTSGKDDCDEKFVGQTFGRINPGEASLLIEELVGCIQRIGEERILNENVDFGIISPYRAQVELLRKLIKKDERLRLLREQFTVNTIDGFQGQERDVIFVSLVRSNSTGQIGFLSDLRRMNVAITRARMKVVLVGSAETLTRHAFYRELYEDYTSAE